jgi:hypothetical protein
MKSETIKYIILEQLLTENRVNQAIEAYPCLPPYMIRYLSANDPSGNNKYLTWMCKMIYDYEARSNEGYIGDYTTIWEWLYDNYEGDGGDPISRCHQTWDEYSNSGSFTATDINNSWEKGICDVVLEEVKIFHRVSAGLPIKDINAYQSLSQLEGAVAHSKIKVKEKELAKDVTKIYEDDTWLIMSPKSHAASCVYGAGSKWCVTMRNDPQYFERYTRGNFYLIFVMNKKTNNKWAINTSTKLDQPSGDVEINLPWHKEIEIGRRDNRVINRFPQNRHNKTVERLYRNKLGNVETTYWNAEDHRIDWNNFIESSGLPERLQQLLKAVEKRIIINFQRKKRGEIAHEVNPTPVRLKKGDHVRLLASGYGVYRGDEGIITSTADGAPGRQKNVDPENAGRYFVHVPGRVATQGRVEQIRNPDGSVREIPVVLIGGNFLQKIDKKKSA